jgi:hypothetical protein
MTSDSITCRLRSQMLTISTKTRSFRSLYDIGHCTISVTVRYSYICHNLNANKSKTINHSLSVEYNDSSACVHIPGTYRPKCQKLRLLLMVVWRALRSRAGKLLRVVSNGAGKYVITMLKLRCSGHRKHVLARCWLLLMYKGRLRDMCWLLLLYKGRLWDIVYLRMHIAVRHIIRRRSHWYRGCRENWCAFLFLRGNTRNCFLLLLLFSSWLVVENRGTCIPRFVCLRLVTRVCFCVRVS